MKGIWKTCSRGHKYRGSGPCPICWPSCATTHAKATTVKKASAGKPGREKNKKKYRIREKVIVFPGETANWRFVVLPKGQAQVIRERFGDVHRGWSSLSVGVKLGKTVWKTSIFYDRRFGSYLLPLKAAVRKVEDVMDGDTITFTIEILV